VYLSVTHGCNTWRSGMAQAGNAATPFRERLRSTADEIPGSSSTDEQGVRVECRRSRGEGEVTVADVLRDGISHVDAANRCAPKSTSNATRGSLRAVT